MLHSNNILLRWTHNPLLRKSVFMHVPVLFSLYLLTDNDSQQEDARHLAVFTALARHPPSMRVFRGLLVLCVLGFCMSMVLKVMEATVGNEMLNRLFFSTPYTLVDENVLNEDSRGYELTGIDAESDSEEEDEREDDIENKNEGSRQNNTTGVNRIRSAAAIICNATLDLLLFTLVALFLFTISSSKGGRYVDQSTESNKIFAKIGDIASPVFPLMLFFICIVKCFLPWTKRKNYLWTVVSYTLGAPLYEVQFRDGFIGDIFTSMVRPMQDIAFTSFYLMSGLQGWWTYREQTSEEHMNLPVERSWLLHTIILPACTVSPLWWRFCQCLRQCYDTKKRWPYLGNAAKYFIAAQVAMFGVFDPQKTGSFIWVFAFICATLYQLWWDIFMDWELLEKVPGSSIFGGFHLRKNRLFKQKALYIFTFIANFILRFGWTLNVMPSRYLSPSGAILNTFSADFPTLIAPTLACAEIFRRSLWGLIRIELEVIKLKSKENVATFDPKSDESLSLVHDLQPMNIENDGGHASGGMITMGSNLKPSSNILFSKDLSAADDIQVVWELCIYATAFTSMGIIAAVHRQVL